ncbi:MAG: lipopolysaccharide biosynthesis protein [Nitrospiraceae bacterium]
MKILDDLKTLGKHSLIYGTGIILGKALGFFLIPVYTHYLAPKDYGILELLDLTGYLVGFLIGLGMDQGILKFHGQYAEGQDRNEVLSTAIIFNILFGGILVLMLIPLSPYFSEYILGMGYDSFLFVLLFAALFLESVLAKGRTILRAQHRSGMFTIVALGYTAAAASLNILFVAGLGLGLRGIYYSALICSSLFSIYLICNILKSTGVAVHREKLKQMVAYGMPFVPAGILAFILQWSDRYILNIYANMETIGIYTLGFKMGMSLVMLIAEPFAFIWNAYLFEIEKRSDARQVYAAIATYFLLATSFGGLILSVYSREIITVIAAKAYENASQVIPIIAAAMVLKCSTVVFQVGLLIKGRSVFIAMATGLAASVSVLANLILIPRYHMMGAAITVLLSMAVYSAMIMICSQGAYLIHFEYRRLGKIVAAALGAYFVAFILNSDHFWTSIALKTGALALFPVLLTMLGFLNAAEIDFLKRWHKDIRGYVLQN